MRVLTSSEPAIVELMPCPVACTVTVRPCAWRSGRRRRRRGRSRPRPRRPGTGRWPRSKRPRRRRTGGAGHVQATLCPGEEVEEAAQVVRGLLGGRHGVHLGAPLSRVLGGVDTDSADALGRTLPRFGPGRQGFAKDRPRAGLRHPRGRRDGSMSPWSRTPRCRTACSGPSRCVAVTVSSSWGPPSNVAVLACLLLARGRVVPADRLARDRLGGGPAGERRCPASRSTSRTCVACCATRAAAVPSYDAHRDTCSRTCRLLMPTTSMPTSRPPASMRRSRTGRRHSPRRRAPPVAGAGTCSTTWARPRGWSGSGNRLEERLVETRVTQVTALLGLDRLDDAVASARALRHDEPLRDEAAASWRCSPCTAPAGLRRRSRSSPPTQRCSTSSWAWNPPSSCETCRWPSCARTPGSPGGRTRQTRCRLPAPPRLRGRMCQSYATTSSAGRGELAVADRSPRR